MDISADRLMESYIDTLQKCGTYLLTMSDDDIEYYIFEEFDIGATTFLHDDTLTKLTKADLINKEIAEKAQN